MTLLGGLKYWRKQQLLERRFKDADTHFLKRCDANIRYFLTEADKEGISYLNQNTTLFAAETELRDEGYVVN